MNQNTTLTKIMGILIALSILVMGVNAYSQTFIGKTDKGVVYAIDPYTWINMSQSAKINLCRGICRSDGVDTVVFVNSHNVQRILGAYTLSSGNFADVTK